MRHGSSHCLKLGILIITLILLLPQATIAAPPQYPVVKPAYVPGEVLIGWDPGTGPVPEVEPQPGALGTRRTDATWERATAEISRATGLAVLAARPERGFARLAVKPGAETSEIARLNSLPWVRYAEHNHLAYATAIEPGTGFYPDDPDFGKQWHLHRIQAPEAWDVTRGSLSFVVAVLDTGVAQAHPDLAGQLRAGYNYVTDRPGAEDDDPGSHGTHVTGILAARIDNGLGVAGLAPDIKILPLKVLSSDRTGRYDAIAAAIYDAVEQQAQVINLSLAGPAPSQMLLDAITFAQSQGCLVVAAAGNCAQNPSSCGGQINPAMYPAAYPGVLAVAASDRFDRVTTYSGYKPYTGLAAPGGTADEPVWSTKNEAYGPLYGGMAGTSMSTPQVSAAAALVWTLSPASSANEVAEILKNTADKVGSDPYSGEALSYMTGRNDYFGSGRLNVANAVRWVYPQSLALAAGQVDMILGGSTTLASRSVAVTNPSAQSVSWQASLLSGSPWLSLSRASGASLYGSPAALTLTADSSNLAPGIYIGYVRVQPVYPAGLAAVDLRVQLRVAVTFASTFAPEVALDLEPTWRDPDAAGNLYYNALPLTNDSLITIDLPFPIQFYGAQYRVLQVSDNGWVHFGSSAGAAAQPPAACPGSGAAPNNAAYVLAYDWDPAQGGQVVVHQPDLNTFVISWLGMQRAGSAVAQSFQLVMTRDSSFRSNYLSVESPARGIVGTENYDGAFAQQVLCNGAGRQVRSGDTIHFTTRLPW